MEQQAIERVAGRYRDEGYEVVVRPRGDQVPPFAAGFQPDLVATRGRGGVIAEVKTNRIDLARDRDITRLAEIVNAQPGWRLDVVVLQPETVIDRAAQEAAEPSDEQLAAILKAAEDLADNGYTPYAYVVAWGGLEAAMRRVRVEGESHGRTTPNELMRTLYGVGVLTREQFDRLKAAFKIRSQVAHGLVPLKADAQLVRDVTAIAKYLMHGEEVAAPSD